MSLIKKNEKFELILFIFFSFCIAFYLNNNFLPAEDASILFRYSENLSDTGVISYNLNDSPTEGATDFLWMVFLSIFYFLGIDTYFASIILNLFSLFITIYLIKEHYSLSKIDIYNLIFFHFSITHTYASLGGFSVLFVELFLVLLILNFLKGNIFKTLLFSFIGCLIRPDFILFIIIPNIINLTKNFNLKNIKFFIFFILLGVIYFYLRYKYFDYLLPLPFYIKNQWSFLNNLEWGRQLIILLPFFLILLFVDISKIFKRSVIVISSIILLATSYYTNQILYQNVGYRFYFYFPILVIFIIYEIIKYQENYKKIARNIILIISFLSIGINGFQKFNSLNFLNKKDDIYIFAKELNNINTNKSLSLATTESGLLPYYSKINTIDLFGLNSKEFAKKPANGSLFLNKDFDIIVINSSVTGDNCNSLLKSINDSKDLKIKDADRNDNWSNFSFKLLYGIDTKKYDSYLMIYPKHIFINTQSIAYIEISNAIEKTKAVRCSF